MKKRPSPFHRLLVWTLVTLIGLILLALAVPLFMPVRVITTSCPISCVANLRYIQGAKQQWAIENKMDHKDIPTDADLFDPSLYLKDKPTCPDGGEYSLNAAGKNANCSTSQGHAL